MRQTRLSFITVGLVAFAAVSWLATAAQAQNDWQYPDPYFGILEIEKSHDGATARRYRGEVNPAPRSSKAATAATPAPATPTPTPAPRNRWRNRWRRQ
jgi:hypothetical protein